MHGRPLLMLCVLFRSEALPYAQWSSRFRCVEGLQQQQIYSSRLSRREVLGCLFKYQCRFELDALRETPRRKFREVEGELAEIALLNNRYVRIKNVSQTAQSS